MKAVANGPQSHRTPVATVAKAGGWGTLALWLILTLLALAWALPAQAGELDVLAGAAAQSTNYGLRVTPGSTCAAANDLNITSASISGPYQACNSITAGVDTTNGVKTTGDTTFTAGDEIVLKHKFTVDAGDAFTAIISSPLTQWAYVQDNSPAAEKTYNASFYLKLNSLAFGNTTDRLQHLVGYSSDGTPRFRVVLRLNSGEKRLVLEAREDGGNWESTEGVSEVMLPAGYNEIEINWSASPLANPSTGEFKVSLNGSPFSGLSDLDNDGAQIDQIKWGAVGTHTSIDAITGTLDVDEFSSWR